MKWISVKHSLPELEQDVLAWNGDAIQKAHREPSNLLYEKNWYWTHYDFMEWHGVTHWMPLPPSPEEEK